MRPFTAIREEAGLSCGSFLRKGEVFAFVGAFETRTSYRIVLTTRYVPVFACGSFKNLKDLEVTFTPRTWRSLLHRERVRQFAPLGRVLSDKDIVLFQDALSVYVTLGAYMRPM